MQHLQSWWSCGRERRETSWAFLYFIGFVQRVFCQQYIYPVWSWGCTIKSVSMIPHDNCKYARYFSSFFHFSCCGLLSSASEPLFSAQFAFIRLRTAADEDKQEAARVTHSAVHFPGMIRGATVPSSAQREGQTGASHCTQTPGITRGRRLYYLPCLPALRTFTGMHAWQQPASDRYTKHRNPSKTNGLSSNNLKWRNKY